MYRFGESGACLLSVLLCLCVLRPPWFATFALYLLPSYIETSLSAQKADSMKLNRRSDFEESDDLGSTRYPV
ncbi:hypothetical protein P171DRAFT_429837, partial [Karstenula rhodostoma CBS 690.94]